MSDNNVPMDVDYHTSNHHGVTEVQIVDNSSPGGSGGGGSNSNGSVANAAAAAQYGYGGPGGVRRRASMSHEEEKSRRASIKAIMADDTLTPHERRRSIQNLMDGRRSSIGTASVASSSGRSGEFASATSGGAGAGGDNNDYGYGDAAPTRRNDYGDDYNNNNSNPYGYGDTGEGHHRNEHLANEPGAYLDSMDSYCVPCSNENTKRAEMTRPPCNHYERKCTIIAPCCGASFGCRICHDDSPILPPLLIAKQAQNQQQQSRTRQRYPRSSSLPGGFTSMAPQTPEETHHPIDRFAIKEVICQECFTKQSSKT